MAGLQERSGGYRINFRYHGKHHFVTLGKISEQEARAKSAQADYLLLRLRQRLIELPPGVGVVEFILHDEKPPFMTREEIELRIAGEGWSPIK